MKINKTIFELLNCILYKHLKEDFVDNKSYYTGVKGAYEGLTDGKKVIDIEEILDYGITDVHVRGDNVNMALLELEKNGYIKRHYPKHLWDVVVVEDKIPEIKKIIREHKNDYDKGETYTSHGIDIILHYRYREHGYTKGIFSEFWWAEIDDIKFSGWKDRLKRDIDTYLRNKESIKGKSGDVYVFDGDELYGGGLIFIKKEKINDFITRDYKFLCMLDELPEYILNDEWEDGMLEKYHFME